MSAASPAFRAAADRLRTVYAGRQRDSELCRLIEAREEVLARFGPLFSADGVRSLWLTISWWSRATSVSCPLARLAFLVFWTIRGTDPLNSCSTLVRSPVLSSGRRFS